MAESLCGGLSEEKYPEKDYTERVKPSRGKARGTGKGVPETEMAETLGCYDGQCGKEERREHSGELQQMTARAPFVLPGKPFHLRYGLGYFSSLFTLTMSFNTLE